jgi:hypothetical protein
MRIEEFRKIIHEREQCHDEWTYGVEQCWKKEIALLTEDIHSTIEFLKNDCTANEYFWISEVLDDVVDIIPSKELVQCYKELMTKFPEEYSKYNIAGSIENAKAILRWEDE